MTDRQLIYGVGGAVLVVLLLLVWHVLTPTPPAHTRRMASSS